ncbi:hypothetical protein M975_1927 [Buttiauxella brennerae ATCC 51605]|uniref:Uncharacterized protein n=1 Tax=Buttiauxella brennerae ATCC 51605 TaxID=1354251 RepID=A0A1B7IQM6_9ENTR|nr:hypothetical protein [Buttiauxella brennerae]OAT32035.1 hypothetical protein M975_1927 [Buttiauxella brennerae ATCC 51605]
MSAAELWDEKAFTELMLDMVEDEITEQVNLAAERGNEQVSWQEFAGNYQ